MSKFKRTLAMLIAVVMVICALPMTVAAEEPGDKDAIKVSKTYNQKTGILTLEAYVTGESQTVVTTQPIDVVLVLDVSGSMDEAFSQNDYVPEYSPEEGEDYYYEVNGEMRKAYYCSTKSGWFDRQHLIIHGGNKLIPKTSESDTNGIQFYRYKSKLDALKEATVNFINLFEGEDKKSSNIALVKFAGKDTTLIGDDTYEENGYVYNYSQTVKALTSADAAGREALIDAVNNLSAGGATHADYGMQHAQSILSPANTDGRKQIVVMFTDGSPTYDNGFKLQTANSAIKTASEMKESGVTIYTIGCFTNADSGKVDRNTWYDHGSIFSGDPYGDNNRYMNLVSSNFSYEAKSMDADFRYYSYKGNGYYKTAANASELSSVFEQISQDIGSASYQLDENTVLKDIITDEFVLPDGASSVTAYTVDFAGKDAEGNMTWGSTEALPAGSVTVEGKTIDVTGFDYSENWVGTLNGTPRGKKLVVEIQITPANPETLYSVVPTNTNESGIYVDGKPVKDFEIPEAVYPYYVIKHVRDGKVIAENVRYNGESGYPGVSLTDKVAELTEEVKEEDENNHGYLYGGAFSSSDCTTAYNFNSGNGIAYTLRKFDDKNVETIYLKEVSDYYLRPKSLTLWETLPNGKKDVVGYYFVTVLDGSKYQKVGFDYNGGIDLNNIEFDKQTVQVGTLGGTNVYSQIELINKQGKSSILTASSFYKEEDGITDGIFACSGVPKSVWREVDATVTFTPYWITLDGVKVTSTRTRSESYQGEGYKDLKYYDDVVHTSEVTPYAPVSTQTLMLSARFMADGSEFIDSEIPVLPDPDPKPDTDFPIIIPSTYTVSVVDGDNRYERKVSKLNNGISLEPNGCEGKLFAGWYSDGIPFDLSKITSDVEVYAKYVSDDYLCTKYIEQGLFRVYGMTLITAIDSTNYEDAGFIINGEKISCGFTENYGTFTARILFGSNISRRAKIITHNLSLRNASNGDTFEVTPYWTTLDGTTVYGKLRTFTYNSRGIIG